MKKFKNICIISSIACVTIFIASCASTPTNQDDKYQSESIVEEIIDEHTTEKIKKEPKPIAVQNTSNQEEKKFKELLSKIDLKLVSSPNAKNPVIAGAAFKTPYVVTVTDENGPVSDFSVTVSWPVARSNNVISYNSKQIKTDENGRVSFLPEPSQIAVKDKVTFYPTPINSSTNIIQEAYNLSVEAPFIVKSKYIQWPGGILYVYDLNKNGKPTTNNVTLLQSLRNSNVNAGNAPISSSSYIEKSTYELYKACLSTVQMNGEQFSKQVGQFLIAGVFKYAQPPIQNDDSTVTVNLVADLTCLNMKDGSILYKTIVTDTATDKTEWNAEQACKKSLAKKAAEDITYGM